MALIPLGLGPNICVYIAKVVLCCRYCVIHSFIKKIRLTLGIFPESKYTFTVSFLQLNSIVLLSNVINLLYHNLL